MLNSEKLDVVGAGRSKSPEQMLLDFLGENDAACPVCRYNLKGLTRPICPECRQDLILTVGVTRLRLGLLLFALAPGAFSGIAACFLAIPTTGIYLEDGKIAWPFVGAILFGWCSAAFAIMLARRRTWFLARSSGQQRLMAALVWFVHFAALVLLVVTLAPLI